MSLSTAIIKYIFINLYWFKIKQV